MSSLSKVSTQTLLLIIVIALSACATRSISNSEYPSRYGSQNSSYRGELSEYDVLGIDPTTTITDTDISNAFAEPRKFLIKKGSSIVLIQSGAMFPDEPMVRSLEKYFSVVPFSGIPFADSAQPRVANNSASLPAGSYSKALRLTAAKGGYETILCYWGVLETAKHDEATKVISWVPIVGWAVPDETQQMRIRMKLALVDVQSGKWTFFSPDSAEDTALSAGFNRENSDQTQVALLKEKAYQDSVNEMLKLYVY